MQGIWYILEWIRRIITLARDVLRSEYEEECKWLSKYLISLKMKVDINECVGEVNVEKVESRGVSRQSAYIELKYLSRDVVSIF